MMPYKDPEKRRVTNKLYQRKHYKSHKQYYINKSQARRLAIRSFVRSMKYTCVCGESHPACLVFHHRDPSIKEFGISQVWQHGWSIDRAIVEIEKCDVLCANCHAKLHWHD